MVWPKIFEIKKRLSGLAIHQAFQESEISLAVVRSAQKCLQRKMDEGILTDLHKAATFLTPKRRLLTGTTEAEKHNVLVLIILIINYHLLSKIESFRFMILCGRR
jgi:hypothetical protein